MMFSEEEIVVYSATHCPGCEMAKGALRQLGRPYKEINIDEHPGLGQQLVAATGMQSVPQIFVNGVFIGGTMDLLRMIQTGTI